MKTVAKTKVNRKTRRAFVSGGKRIAFIEGNELYMTIHGQDAKIADLDPRWKRHGITIDQLLKEYISVVEIQVDESPSDLGVDDDDSTRQG